MLSKLLRELRHQNTLIKQAKIARTKRLKESMVIIAKAMQNGDCNHSEGVIRFINAFTPFWAIFAAISSDVCTL